MPIMPQSLTLPMALMTSTDLVLSLQISLMTWICDGRDLPHTEQQMESLETNPLSYQTDPNERFR